MATQKSNNPAIVAMQEMMQRRIEQEPEFALKMANPNKSMEGAINYLCNEVKKSGLCVLTDEAVEAILVHYWDEEDIKAVDNIGCNIELDIKEVMQLKNGATLRDREIITKDGRRFKADLRYSIDRRALGLINMTSLKQKENVSQKETTGQSDATAKKKVYNFTDAEGNPKRLRQWYQIPMDERKQGEYLAGNNVEVGVLNVEGKDYMVYLQFNKEKKMPESSFGIMENGKVVGFADASKVQAAINLQGKTNEATRNVTDKLDMGQTEPKNQKQKARQKPSDPQEAPKKKPKGPKL